MECKNIINLLDNKLNQPSKFGTKNWVKTNCMECAVFVVK